MKKQFLLLSAILLSSNGLLQADGETHAQTSADQAKSGSLINPPGRPEVKNGVNLFITADYLIWQATEQSITAWEKGGVTQSAGTNAVTGHFESPKFEWCSGSRVGLGYNIGHDQWDLSLTWTWFEDHAKKHAAEGPAEPLFGSISSPLYELEANRGSTHLRLLLNMLDLELGKEFYTSKWLTLRPFAGLRTAWIHQHWNTKFDDVTSTNFLQNIRTFTVHLNQKFWGIGPRVGLDAEFGLISGLSLFSNGSFNLLYSYFKDTRREDIVSNQNVKSITESSKQANRSEQAILDIQLGLRWDQMLAKDRFHIRIQSGWEHHLFFNHNQFFSFTQAGASSITTPNGNLGFQGWFISGRFDF
ncbi:MAG: hypothetical protein JSR39_10820 [Verrucomicrobia bacterium]|nr:hypothetical protein [Verrucomicrobiota bacterium]